MRDPFPSAFSCPVLLWLFIATIPISNVTNEPDNRYMLESSSTDTVDVQGKIEKIYRAALFVDTEIELSISITNLFGPFGCETNCWAKVDPICVTYIRPYGDRWIEYHRTELLFENSNPRFARKVTLPYSLYQKRWSLKFSLYSVRHWDKTAGSHLKNHYLIGSAECNFDQLLRLGKIELSLTPDILNEPSLSCGKVIVHAEKLTNKYDDVTLKLAGADLAQRNWLGCAELYIEVYKYHDASNEFILVHRTEMIKDSTNLAQWKSMTIPIKRLCNGDYRRMLKFVAWNWRKTGEAVFIGEFHTTLNDMSRGDQNIFTLNNNWREEDENPGQIYITNFHLDIAPTLFDLIRFGLRIRCVVAIDFTSVNGDPRLPGTLHYRNALDALNMYEKAIVSTLSVFEYFKFDNKFSLLGFGGRYWRDPNNPVFSMGPGDSPGCIGVEGVLDAYRKRVPQIVFSEPRNIALVIRKTVMAVSLVDPESNYFILLILTCGELDDIDETEKILTEASTLPISIIIVGIGDLDFITLKELDDNIVPKRTGDRKRRDIVNFVSFREFSSQNDIATSYLASEFMAEIPAQVVSYVRSKGFTPYAKLYSVYDGSGPSS